MICLSLVYIPIIESGHKAFKPQFCLSRPEDDKVKMVAVCPSRLSNEAEGLSFSHFIADAKTERSAGILFKVAILRPLDFVSETVT